MGRAMMRSWRGRFLLWASKRLTRWAWTTNLAGHRALGISAVPDDYPFATPSDWGQR